MKSLSLFRRKSPQRWKNRKKCGLFHIEKEKRRINKWKRPQGKTAEWQFAKTVVKTTFLSSCISICSVWQNRRFGKTGGLAKQATSRTHLIDFLPSVNEEDSYRFSDSRSLMSKLPRRVSASSGLPKGVQLCICTFSKRSFTCLDTTVYSFRSHISPQT